MNYQCPRCGNTTDFNMKCKNIKWFVKCAKCGFNGSEKRFVKKSG